MTILTPTKSRLDLVRQYLDAFNRGDWPMYKATLTPDSIHLEPGVPEMRGPDAIIAGVKIFRDAMPDLTGTVTRIVEGKDETAAEIVWRGTHTGPLATPSGPIAPTGRPVTVHACKVFGFEGNLIRYARHYWDMTELLGAIGALPTRG